jgi:signal transduction histidine kinase
MKQERSRLIVALLSGRDGTDSFLQLLDRAMNRKRLALVTLVVSLIAHGLTVFVVLLSRAGIGLPFQEELLALIGLSVALEIAAFSVPSVIAFRTVHAARFFVLLLAFKLLEGKLPLVLSPLSIPFLIEAALYDDSRVAYPVNIGFICAAVIGIARRFQPDDRTVVIAAVASYVIVTATPAGLASLLIYYREALVDKSAQIENQRSTVLNLTNANKAFQRYAGHVESESTERERNRITRELHDVVGYALTNVIVMMNAGRLLIQEDPGKLDEILEKVGNQSEAALDETRQALYRLRSVRSYDPRGMGAIVQLIQSFQGATGIEVEFHNMGNIPPSLGPGLDSALFRFIQEGLTNAFRHGKADAIWVNLWRTEDEIRVSVSDNGNGVESGGTVVEGIGITGMRERLSEFGGKVSAMNLTDGFELRATIPFRIGEVVHEDQSSDS